MADLAAEPDGEARLRLFFRQELRAKRGLYRPVSEEWIVNFLYEALSGYGQSIVRPLSSIVVCFAIGFLIFQGTPVYNVGHLTRPKAAWLSLANIFAFLPIKREIFSPAIIEGFTNTGQIVSAVQSLLGAILLFLVVLALRNRFRMK
jgi:hypothetical protein